MRIAGKWVGFGLGDADPAVGKLRDLMKRKFSYARSLPDTTVEVTPGVFLPLFDEPMFLAVVQMQTNYENNGMLRAGSYSAGIINAETQYVMGYAKRPTATGGGLPPPEKRPRGTLYTCQGTKPSDMWTGPQGDLARAVEDLYYWQPIFGPYEAVPMNKSITPEKAGLLAEIEKRPVGDPINAVGYSQGAIVISEVYEDMKRTKHPRLGDWKRAVTWGNPSRQLGVCNGNRWARNGFGYPELDKNSRGIMEDKRRLTDTPDWWMDFGHPGDMYVDTPNDDAGEFQTAICMMIMGNFTGGNDNIFRQLYEWSQRPLIETFFVGKAVLNAGLFFGGGIKPHITYDVRPAIDYLRS